MRTQRYALRESGRGAGLSGLLGTALGRHAHAWHDETPSRSHVHRRKASLASPAFGTLPLLPMRIKSFNKIMKRSKLVPSALTFIPIVLLGGFFPSESLPDCRNYVRNPPSTSQNQVLWTTME